MYVTIGYGRQHCHAYHLCGTLCLGAEVGFHFYNFIADVVLIMSLPQGGQNMSALLAAMGIGEEPITVTDCETTATTDATGPPIRQE